MELTKCKLGELITQRREKNDGSDLPICGVSKDGLIPPKQVDADTSIYNVFYRDDFIFNPARMELNSIAINDKYDRAICSSLYEVFYVHRTDLLLPHYLKLIVKQKWFTRYCEFLGQGSAREYCRFNNISEIEVEFPNVEMQQKIVDYYASLQERIKIKRQINDNLLATTQAIYKSWFVDFEPFEGVCPQSWLNGCVDDIAEFYDSMRKPLSSLERADMERIYPYYGAVSIVDYVDDFIFDGEYLLVSEDGIYVVDENGRPLLQHITGKFWANNHAHILKGKAGFNEDSLYLFLANTNMAPIVTGAAQPKINQANLKSFPITIPTSDVIEKFNALIQPFFDQRLSNEAEGKHLENLKDLLLSRLVN